MKKLASAVLTLSLFTAVTFGGAGSAAAESTIKTPGDHPHYVVEVEPHGLWGFTHFNGGLSDGFGLGARVSIPITDDGFIKTINNSVGVTFGLDWLHYAGGCYGFNTGGGCFATTSADYLFLPVALQWNFFVAPHWSVFGEPGLAIYHGFFNYCDGLPSSYGCGYPTSTSVSPVLYVGGRYHFNEHVALTMRIGYPTFSLGVSFM